MDQNKKPASILSKEKLIEEVINQIIEFKSKWEVKSWVKSKSNDSISEEEVNQIIELAFKRLKETVEDADIINSHVANYNKIIDYFKKIGYTAGLNRAMRAKENLLRVGKTSSVNITSECTNSINSSEPQYDINKLTPEEKERWELYTNLIEIN